MNEKIIPTQNHSLQYNKILGIYQRLMTSKRIKQKTKNILGLFSLFLLIFSKFSTNEHILYWAQIQRPMLILTLPSLKPKCIYQLTASLKTGISQAMTATSQPLTANLGCHIWSRDNFSSFQVSVNKSLRANCGRKMNPGVYLKAFH